MAKAQLRLTDGTMVTLEGTPEEVHRLLKLYSGETPAATPPKRPAPKKKASSSRKKLASPDTESPDLNDLVNLVKNCDEADAIEKNVLDRASQVDRILLPLYVVHEYKENKFGLTSGEISKVTTELGVRVTQPNASTTLSATASRYVMGDKVRKKGQPVRYRLSRRGLQYMKSVISGGNDAD